MSSEQIPDLYRSTHMPAPTRSNPSSTGKPWVLLSTRDVADWRLAHPEATCSDRAARCLAWLAQEFGR